MMDNKRYKRLGDYIQVIDDRNKELLDIPLLGVSVQKRFIPSIANTIGTNFTKYKVLSKNEFTYIPDTSRRGDKIGIALLKDHEKALVSQAYTTFRIIDTNKLNPDYLMMWFSRPEFDRYARYHSIGSVREVFNWSDMLEVELPIPSIERQEEIVAQYQAVADKIKINEQICEQLETAAQTLYKEWFVMFNFPDENGKPYKDNGGKMVWNEELEKEIPEGWEVKSLGEICDKIASGSTPKGGEENYKKEGISLIRSKNIHDLKFIYDDLAFIDKKQSEKLSNVSVSESDLLFNITGVSVARCTIVPLDVLPARVNQHVMIIRPKLESELNYYLLMNLISTESKSQLLGISQSGSTREAITKSDIENFRLIVPKKENLLKYNRNILIPFILIESKRKLNQKLTQLQSLLLTRITKEN